MEILLVVVVIAVLVAVAVQSMRSYEKERLRNPQAKAASDDSLLFMSSGSDAGHSSHGHASISCGDSHHAGCDVGHGGFDGAHGGFDGGGHH